MTKDQQPTISANPFDLWDFGDPAASEAHFRDAADAASTDDEEGLLLTQVARAQGLQGKFDEARQTLDHALRLIGDTDSAAGVQYALELGRVENSSGRRAAAMPHFAEALRLAQALGTDYAAADAAHMLAIAADLEEQPNYGKAALAVAKAAKDERARRWIGPILNNLGWSYVDMGQPDLALPYFEESLQFRISQGASGPIRTARYALGCALRACGSFEAALRAQLAALEMGGSAGYIEEEIGECLVALSRAEEARPFFAAAHEKLSANTDLSVSDPGRLARILNRA
ncbi:MAG: tetratricopeptide repeat protein [Fimbriimonadaceae bacterium]